MLKLILPILLLLLQACGNKSSFQSFQAPRTNQQAGIIAACTTESQALSIAQTYGAKFRVINQKARLMEIIGVDPADIIKINPKAKLKNNKIYNDLIEVSANSVSSNSIEVEAQSVFSHLQQIDAHQLPSSARGNGVVVAVIDSGVWMGHEHLSHLIYQNSAETNNGQDSDGNGKIDDIRGWDFYNWDNDPSDDHGHGTHVAGLVVGAHSGIASEATILPIKVLSHQGRGDLATITAGILYAIERGAQVINLSLGGPSGGAITQEIQNLINSVQLGSSQGIMFVAASGNGGEDGIGDCNDEAPIYPANINNQALISVAAVNSQNQLTTYSNFGPKTVHVAAPGGTSNFGLFSTYKQLCTGNCHQYANYAAMNGTSMAAPIVSGLIAAIKSVKPNLTTAQIRQIVLNTGTEHASLDNKVQSGRVINAKRAIEAALAY
jgi:subtilisin family serine protease